MKMRLVSMAGEILPLAGLFIGNALADIFIGALAAVCLAAGVVFYNRMVEHRWANFAVFSVVVSAVFAFAALVTEDSLFIRFSLPCSMRCFRLCFLVAGCVEKLL